MSDQQIRDELGLNGSPHTPHTPHTPTAKGVLPPVESFPVAALPEGCWQLVREASDTIGCPADFVAVPMLASLGSAIGVSHVIQIIEGWTEAPNLYVATVGHPGARKTPPAREAKRPVAGYQAKLRKDYKEQVREYEQDQRDEPPVKQTNYVDDITTESLIETLDKSPLGVIQFKDELLGLIRSLDQYKGGRGSDRQFYLSGWSGEAYSYKRKGTQEDIFLQRPFLAVVGSIQTDLLHEIADGREDGLADRFLYSYPDKVRSRISRKKGIREEARKSYARLYMRLRDLKHEDVDEYGHPESRIVKCTESAEELLWSLINNLRDEAELPGFPSRLAWVWPKLEAYLARLTLIWALCRCVNLRAVGQDVELCVEQGDVLKAGTIIEYFKSHIRRVYTHLYRENSKERLVEDLARFLLDHGGSWRGAATELHEKLDSRFKPERPDDLSKFLKNRALAPGDITYHSTSKEATRPDGGRTSQRVLTLALAYVAYGAYGEEVDA